MSAHLRTATWADAILERDVVLNHTTTAAATQQNPADIPLGVELSLSEIADGGLAAVVSSVAPGSMASAVLGGEGMRVGDRILAVNGTVGIRMYFTSVVLALACSNWLQRRGSIFRHAACICQACRSTARNVQSDLWCV